MWVVRSTERDFILNISFLESFKKSCDKSHVNEEQAIQIPYYVLEESLKQTLIAYMRHVIITYPIDTNDRLET